MREVNESEAYFSRIFISQVVPFYFPFLSLESVRKMGMGSWLLLLLFLLLLVLLLLLLLQYYYFYYYYPMFCQVQRTVSVHGMVFVLPANTTSKNTTELAPPMYLSQQMLIKKNLLFIIKQVSFVYYPCSRRQLCHVSGVNLTLSSLFSFLIYRSTKSREKCHITVALAKN